MLESSSESHEFENIVDGSPVPLRFSSVPDCFPELYNAKKKDTHDIRRLSLSQWKLKRDFAPSFYIGPVVSY